MKTLVAKGLSQEDAMKAIDYAAIEKRFTNGDPFLTHRFQDYVVAALADAAYLAETGAEVTEPF
jgi:hypothetical protein